MDVILKKTRNPPKPPKSVIAIKKQNPSALVVDLIQSYKWVIVIWTEHTCTVYLGGPEGPPPWLGSRSAETFEFRVPILA